jgi:hypothetical protein
MNRKNIPDKVDEHGRLWTWCDCCSSYTREVKKNDRR